MKCITKKLCLLGDFAVGKTSLVRRYVYDLFDEKYLSTIGVKVSRKVIVVPDGDDLVELSMMLWDLAGSEEFDQFRAGYLRGLSGAVLVCDRSRPETFASMPQYVEQIRRVNPEACFVLAANKTDLVGDGADREIAALAASLAAPLFPTSARTGAGVSELFRQLGRLLV